MLPIGNRFTVFLIQYEGAWAKSSQKFLQFSGKIFVRFNCYFANFMTGVLGLEDLRNAIATLNMALI